MSLQQISRHCYFLPHEQLTDRPALGYIHSRTKAFGVDAGNSAAHAAQMAEAIRSLGLPPVDALAVTHSHWDHTYGLHAYPIPTYAEERTQAQLQVMAGWRWTLPDMEARVRSQEDIQFCHEHMLLEYLDLNQIRVTPASHAFHEQLCIDLGCVTAEVMHWPSSHTDDCAVVYVPEDKVLYLGDIGYEDLHHEPVCIHRQRFMQLMEKLEACDFELCVPGHQPPMSKAAWMADMRSVLTADGLLLLDD